MKNEFAAFLLLAFVTSLIRNGYGQCNTCGINSNVSCISETQYHACYNGMPDFSKIYRCPADQVCTASKNGCKKEARYDPPACRICNSCNRLRRFTCKTISTYVPCCGSSDTPVSFWEISCPSGLICNPAGTRDEPCMQPVSWRDRPLCLKGEDQFYASLTTTALPPFSQTPSPAITAWCQRENLTGLFPNKIDPSCRTYVRCYLANGVIVGSSERCATGTLFNPTLKVCSAGYTCA
uniref:CSON006966 protein n=1 Tax=Culicoides sonorensis TaxID=179676 RepID=A0A336N5M2_CULSO